MNEKTRIQIEEMKKQTIGVEVEMNSITREKQQGLQLHISEQADTKTQRAETVTALGRLGMRTAESGNFRET